MPQNVSKYLGIPASIASGNAQFDNLMSEGVSSIGIQGEGYLVLKQEGYSRFPVYVYKKPPKASPNILRIERFSKPHRGFSF